MLYLISLVAGSTMTVVALWLMIITSKVYT